MPKKNWRARVVRGATRLARKTLGPVRYRSLMRRAKDRLPARLRHRLLKLRGGFAGKTPIITVVIPSFNVEQYLNRCLNSISNQTIGNIEIIIVNDGSTDRTAEIAKQAATKDPRISIVTQENAGLSEARNTGLRHTRGKYVIFVDADDTLTRDALKVLLKSLERSGSDLAVGRYDRFRSKSLGSPRWILKAHETLKQRTTLSEHPAIMANIIAMPKLYRRSFLQENDLTFVPGILYEDQDFAARVYTRAKAIDVVPDLVYHWYVRDDGSSISQRTRELENSLGLLDAIAHAARIYRDSGLPNAHRNRLLHMMRVDLPPLMAVAAEADSQHKEAISSRLRELLDGVSVEMWQATPLPSRMQVYCALNDQWNDLLDFNEWLRTEGVPLPAQEIEGELWVEPGYMPEHLVSNVPEWMWLLTSEDTSFVANLSGLRWLDEHRLEVSGWAFTRGLSTPPGAAKITLTLVGQKTNTRFTVPTAERFDPRATEWAKHRNADYEGTGFSGVIDLNQIAFDRESRWSFEVSIHQGDTTRSGSFTHRYRGGSAERLHGVRWRHGDALGYAFVRIDPKSGPTLTFRPDARIVDGFHVDVTRSLATATITVPANVSPLVSAVAIDRISRRSVRSRLVRRGNTYSLRLSVPNTPRTRHWELLAEDKRGKAHPLTSMDPALGDDPGQTAESLRWARTPHGFAELMTGPTYISVQDVSIDAHRIRITVTHGSSAVAMLAKAALERGSIQVRASEVIDRLNGSSTLVFPTTATLFGTELRTLPSGNYRLSVPSPEDGTHLKVTVDGRKIHDLNREWENPRLNAVVWREPKSLDLRITISPPHARAERGARSQAKLQRWYQSTEFTPRDAALFQCYRGEVATDSQRALHEALRSRSYPLELFWGVKDLSVPIPEGGVPVVIGSRGWYEIVGSARFLCNNIDFDRFFRRRPYQYVLATFHGYPFKAMGRTHYRSEGLTEHRIQIELERRHREWSAIVVPSQEAAEMYRNEYDFQGKALITGYPRNDLLVAEADAIRKRTLERLEVSDSKKIVLFAPTWRETMATSDWSARLFDQLDLDRLARSLGDEYAILVRGHNFNARETTRLMGSRLIDVTDYPEINDLIHASDVAILDYSSLRFDWAITEKPVIFFVPDKEEYFAARPSLFDYDESAPGPQVKTTADVIDLLKDVDALADGWKPHLRAFNETFNTLHDGHASDRLIESVRLHLQELGLPDLGQKTE